MSDSQEPSPPPSPVPLTGSLPSPPPGLLSEGASEYSDDEGDQSDLEDGSSEEANSFGTAEVEVNLGEDGEISDNLSDDYSSDEDSSSDLLESGSIDSTGGCGVPLYPDSSITDDGFNTVFLSLVQHHNLTYASQSDLLKFFTILLPSPSRVPSSSHTLISKYVNFKEDTIVQHFCGFCTCPIESGSSCDQQQCI